MCVSENRKFCVLFNFKYEAGLENLTKVFVYRSIKSWSTFQMYKYEAGMWWARLSWKITIKSDCCISQTADFHTGMLICVKLYQNKQAESVSTEFTANVTQKYRYPGKFICVLKSGSVSIYTLYENEERNTSLCNSLLGRYCCRRFLWRKDFIGCSTRTNVQYSRQNYVLL